MKKVIIALLMVGLFGACSKDEEEKLSPLQMLEHEKLKIDQEKTNKLFEGVWEHNKLEKITISKNHVVYQRRDDTIINTRNPLWIKTNNIYQLVDMSRGAEDYIYALSLSFYIFGENNNKISLEGIWSGSYLVDPGKERFLNSFFGYASVFSLIFTKVEYLPL